MTGGNLPAAGPGSTPPIAGMGAHPPVFARPARPRNRRLRLLLAVPAGFLSLLCVGGVGVALSLYEEATEIRRSSPAAVAESFLRAYFVDRNDQAASLYRCKSGGNISELRAFRSEIEAAERQYGLKIRVTWTSFDLTVTNDSAIVGTSLIRTLSDNSERDAQRWQIQLVDQDGWRVCGGTELS